jgi:chromosome partitioning protein
MAVRLAVANHKGGVAKSTTTMMVAEGLALQYGLRVLIIDMDPQCSLSTMLLSREGADEQADRGRSISALLKRLAHKEPIQLSKFISNNASDLTTLRDATDARRVDLIASDRMLLVELDGIETLLRDRSPNGFSKKVAAALKPELDRIDKSYDVVLFDCPASAGALTLSALRLCEFILSPTLLDVVSMSALSDFIKIVVQNGVTEVRLKVLPTMFKAGDPEHRLTLDHIRAGVLGLNAITTPVPDTVHIRRAGKRLRPNSYRDLREKYGGAVSDLAELAAAVHEFISPKESKK